MNHYRDIYKTLYCVDVDDYDVHHIDHDRSNNDIENLLPVPPYLHKEYHVKYLKAERIGFEFPKKMFSNNVCKDSYDFDIITDYLQVLSECSRYMDMKIIADMRLKNKGGRK